MPWKPNRPCRAPGCPEVTNKKVGFCERHAHLVDAQLRASRERYDKNRPSATQRGYGKVHRKWAAKVLARDPICQCQGYPGCKHPPGECYRPSTCADHRNGDNRDRRMENGQGLCASCHSRKTIAEQGALRRKA